MDGVGGASGTRLTDPLRATEDRVTLNRLAPALSESVDGWPLAITIHQDNRGHAQAGNRSQPIVTGER